MAKINHEIARPLSEEWFTLGRLPKELMKHLQHIFSIRSTDILSTPSNYKGADGDSDYEIIKLKYSVIQHIFSKIVQEMKANVLKFIKHYNNYNNLKESQASLIADFNTFSHERVDEIIDKTSAQIRFFSKQDIFDIGNSSNTNKKTTQKQGESFMTRWFSFLNSSSNNSVKRNDHVSDSQFFGNK